MKSNLMIAIDFVEGKTKGRSAHMSIGRGDFENKPVTLLMSYTTPIVTRISPEEYIFDTTRYSHTTEGKHKQSFKKAVITYNSQQSKNIKIWGIPDGSPSNLTRYVEDFINQMSLMKRVPQKKVSELVLQFKYLEEVQNRFKINIVFTNINSEAFTKMLENKLPKELTGKIFRSILIYKLRNNVL
jgi:hypothetical protein